LACRSAAVAVHVIMTTDLEHLSMLRADAIEIANAFSDDLDSDVIIGGPVRSAVGEAPVDIVAVGKTAREMTAAVRDAGVRVRREFIVCDERSARQPPVDVNVHIGEHPVPGAGSLSAGTDLIEFLEQAPPTGVTVFLVSGGGSSVCCVPAPPVRGEDLVTVWHSALAAGWDIGTLNEVRTATSALAGGLVRRHVRTPRSLSFICVDNVVSGATGTASGLTFDSFGDETRIQNLIERSTLAATETAARLIEAISPRNGRLAHNAPPHDNVVVADSTTLLSSARARAVALGYKVVELGATLSGDVREIASVIDSAISRADRGRACVIGVGEATVRVVPGGRGGRCQQLALMLAGPLAERDRAVVAVARASDGCDYLPDVGGAWVDSTTVTKASAAGLDIADAIARCNAHSVLDALGQLIEGSVTGWNLCDLFVSCQDD
jgi:glycerate 2-kinase